MYMMQRTIPQLIYSRKQDIHQSATSLKPTRKIVALLTAHKFLVYVRQRTVTRRRFIMMKDSCLVRLGTLLAFWASQSARVIHAVTEVGHARNNPRTRCSQPHYRCGG